MKTDKISGGVAVETEDGTVFVQRTGIVVTINGKESATTYNDLAEALNGTAGQTDVAITLLGTDGSKEYSLDVGKTIGENQTVVVADGVTLKVTVTTKDTTYPLPVSYTHLDVYKRQEYI